MQEKTVASAHYANVFSNSYYHGIYNIQRMAGFQFSFSAVDSEMLDRMLSMEWSGANYSSRIWNNTSTLAKELREQLILSYLTGKKGSEIASEIANKFGVSAYKARRLVRTESCFQANMGQLAAYEEADIEKYMIVATLDLRTSPVCREMDGRIFERTKASIGSNMPPFHPFCRSTTVAVFGDEDLHRLKRRARDPVTGESKLIPADTNYKQWYQKNVANNPKAQAAEKMIKNWHSDTKQYAKYKEALGRKEVGKTFADFQDMKYNNVEKWKETKALYRKNSEYNKIIAKEPQITETLKGISEKYGVEMKGLDNRLKSKDSYLRKVATKTKNSTDLDVIKNTINDELHDIIRYTYIDKPDNLVNTYNKIVNDMKQNGYELVRTKNTWTNKRSAYKGINSVFSTPDGTKFEVQFHTPESYNIKDGKMHKLYEDFRKDSTDDRTKQEISKQMFALSKDMVVPTNIEAIK